MTPRHAVSQAQAARARIVTALDRIAAGAPGDETEALVGLVAALRPRRGEDTAAAERNVRELTLALPVDERRCTALRAALSRLFGDKHWVHMLADSGVLSGEGFVTGLGRRLGHQILPDALEPDSLRDQLRALFPRQRDHEWVAAVSDENWLALLDVLELERGPSAAETTEHVAGQILEAIQVISYRIAAIGLESELVRNYPAIERYESPFLAQSEEVRQLIRERDAALAEGRDPTLDDRHLMVLLRQCLDIVSKIRRQAEKTGASITLTALILRLQQNIGRTTELLELLKPRPAVEQALVRVHFFKRWYATPTRITTYPSTGRATSSSSRCA